MLFTYTSVINPQHVCGNVPGLLCVSLLPVVTAFMSVCWYEQLSLESKLLLDNCWHAVNIHKIISLTSKHGAIYMFLGSVTLEKHKSANTQCEFMHMY